MRTFLFCCILRLDSKLSRTYDNGEVIESTLSPHLLDEGFFSLSLDCTYAEPFSRESRVGEEDPESIHMTIVYTCPRAAHTRCLLPPDVFCRHSETGTAGMAYTNELRKEEQTGSVACPFNVKFVFDQ